MHNLRAISDHRLRSRRVELLRVAVLLSSLVVAGILCGCARPEKDAGSVTSLSSDKPLLREYRGAQLYLLREGESVVALWGISPLSSGETGKVRCFIQDRTDREFQGERQVFVDPCRRAWWSHDGRFLGYSGDPPDSPSTGPPLVRIPAEVRDGRVILDDTYLRCLQMRQTDCRQGEVGNSD
jgi:hypothetical protein